MLFASLIRFLLRTGGQEAGTPGPDLSVRLEEGSACSPALQPGQNPPAEPETPSSVCSGGLTLLSGARFVPKSEKGNVTSVLQLSLELP